MLLDYADDIEILGFGDRNRTSTTHPQWPFNDPGYTVFPGGTLRLAVLGDPATGSYPQEMLVDWARVFNASLLRGATRRSEKAWVFGHHDHPRSR